MFLPLTGAATAAEPQLLRWHLQAGEQLKLRILQTNTTETVVKDKPLVMTVDMAMELAWRVDRVEPDGNLLLTQSFTRFAFRTTVPDTKPVQWDSASPQDPPADMRELAEVVRPLLRVKCQVTMTARGEITSVTTPAETESQIRNLPGAANVLRLLTTEGLNGTLRQSLGVLPAGPIAVGGTWTAESDLSGGANKIHLVSTYTHRGTDQLPDRPVERIAVTTAVSLPAEKTGAFEEAPKTPRQQYTGTLFFDAAAGRLVKSELKQATGHEPPQREKKLPLKASNTVVLTIQ